PVEHATRGNREHGEEFLRKLGATHGPARPEARARRRPEGEAGRTPPPSAGPARVPRAARWRPGQGGKPAADPLERGGDRAGGAVAGGFARDARASPLRDRRRGRGIWLPRAAAASSVRPHPADRRRRPRIRGPRGFAAGADTGACRRALTELRRRASTRRAVWSGPDDRPDRG